MLCGSSVCKYLESHTFSYNALRHETFKFADEGANSLETKQQLLVALQESTEKASLGLKWRKEVL